MSDLKTTTKKTSKQLAQQMAKQFADESLESLKEGRKQITGVETTAKIEQQKDVDKAKGIDTSEPEITQQKEAKMKAQSKRQMQALEKEIKDISLEDERKKDEVKQIKAQKRIEEGQSNQQVLIEPASKPKGGMMGKLKKLQNKSEIRMPPSG